MESDHKNLLYYTKVRWHSKGNVLLVFELLDELAIFLNDVKPELAVHFTNSKIHYWFVILGRYP